MLAEMAQTMKGMVVQWPEAMLYFGRVLRVGFLIFYAGMDSYIVCFLSV